MPRTLTTMHRSSARTRSGRARDSPCCRAALPGLAYAAAGLGVGGGLVPSRASGCSWDLGAPFSRQPFGARLSALPPTELPERDGGRILRRCLGPVDDALDGALRCLVEVAPAGSVAGHAANLGIPRSSRATGRRIPQWATKSASTNALHGATPAMALGLEDVLVPGSFAAVPVESRKRKRRTRRRRGPAEQRRRIGGAGDEFEGTPTP